MGPRVHENKLTKSTYEVQLRVGVEVQVGDCGYKNWINRVAWEDVRTK